MTLGTDVVPVVRIERLARRNGKRYVVAGLAHAARSCRLSRSPHQHGGESVENPAHLRRLVGKDVGVIHVVDHRGVVSLEDQQRAIPGFRAIHGEIFESDALGHRRERGSVPAAEIDVEGAHPGLFLAALLGALRHAGVEVPDVPAVGDRHMAGDKAGRR